VAVEADGEFAFLQIEAGSSFATCMTLSPAQHVWPNRSTRNSLGGFSAAGGAMLSERAPRALQLIGQISALAFTSRTVTSTTMPLLMKAFCTNLRTTSMFC